MIAALKPFLIVLCGAIVFSVGTRHVVAFSISSPRQKFESTISLNESSDDNSQAFSPSRRALVSAVLVGVPLMLPQPSLARYVLDEETGDYVEVEDKPWQDEWKARLDKASTMTTDEIFEAARGAGNTNLKTGPESDASRKRRAMSACRDASVRAKAGLKDEKECTAKVFGGEVDFLLEVL